MMTLLNDHTVLNNNDLQMFWYNIEGAELFSEITSVQITASVKVE